jgi:hypothetical protein
MTWIKELQDIPHGESDEARLASVPSTQITTWQGYDINGYRFHTKEKDKKSVAQNSVFDMRASTSQRGRPRHTLGRLKRYGNLTTVVTYS